MPFRSDTAAVTLCGALDALAELWPWIDGPRQKKLEGLIRQYSVPVFRDPPSVQVSRALAFLEALWGARELLPPGVTSALEAGRGTAERMVIGIDRESMAALERSVLRMTDPRQYTNPASLARRASELIAARQDRLVGSEQTAWQRCDAAYRRDHDAEAYLGQVERLLGHYPAIAELLARGKSWVPVRCGEPAPVAGPGREPAGQDAAAVFRRHANVHFPAIVLLTQQMVPLVVHVAPHYEPSSAASQEASALMQREGDLTIVVHAEGFSLGAAIGGRNLDQSPWARVVEATAGRDCEPVVFFLNPHSPGARRLSIDIYQLDHSLATLSFTTEVVDQATAGRLPNVQIEDVVLETYGVRAAPPDLELRVTLSQDRRTLSYTLHSPGGTDYNFKPAGDRRLTGDPSRILEHYFDRLSRLARHPAEDRSPEWAAHALGELADMGANLYAELFPLELQREYARIRENYRGGSLLITSDEPWIPWELVKPVAYDEAGKLLYDDPFLCESFLLSHWLAGRGAPHRLALKRGLLVASAEGLPYVEQEAAYFAQLHREQWSVSITGPVSDTAAVKQALSSGDTQLFHFACHGNFDAEDPAGSRVKLADGSLAASDIVGARQGGLRQARPVIFINACQAGRLGFALTGLGGWAERFVNAGAGAFVGTLWEINDRLAAQFAIEFYNRLWGLHGCAPMALGEAFHAARQAIKTLDAGNPTWLAYVLYGDPEAHAFIGAQA